METIIESPIGPVFARASAHGIAELRFVDAPSPRATGTTLADSAAGRWLDVLQRELEAYFSGARRKLAVSIDVQGTPFQHRVWELVRSIPFGETRSYGEIALAAGAPRASRAVGAANGQNRVSLLVPCHRVVGHRGGLTGYAWGIEKKRWLLDHEAGLAERAASAHSSSPPEIANSRLLSTISRSSLPTLKKGNRLAATGTGSPVRGLRPL